jgi:hypothetical protein
MWSSGLGHEEFIIQSQEINYIIQTSKQVTTIQYICPIGSQSYLWYYPIQYIKNCWVRLVSNYNIKYMHVCTIYTRLYICLMSISRFAWGPSNEHFWQVWLKSVQRFHRRRFKCEKLTDAYPWQKLTWAMARWAKKE